MSGAHEGGTSLRIGAESRTLRFDWAALSKLRAKYGADFGGVINLAMEDGDLDTIAEVVSVGIAGRMTPAEITKASPPIVATVSAISLAINLAYHGPDALREGRESPLVRLARKIDALIANAIRFWMRLRNGSESAPATSPASTL